MLASFVMGRDFYLFFLSFFSYEVEFNTRRGVLDSDIEKSVVRRTREIAMRGLMALEIEFPCLHVS